MGLYIFESRANGTGVQEDSEIIGLNNCKNRVAIDGG